MFARAQLTDSGSAPEDEDRRLGCAEEVVCNSRSDSDAGGDWGERRVGIAIATCRLPARGLESRLPNEIQTSLTISDGRSESWVGVAAPVGGRWVGRSAGCAPGFGTANKPLRETRKYP